MSIHTHLLTLSLTALITFQLEAQMYEPALAFSMSKIIIDGYLEDWPQDVNVYPINHLEFGETTEMNDLKGSFRIGYDASVKAIYLAVEVIDTDHVTSSVDDNIDLVDVMYLYFDPIHNEHGGSRVLYLAGEKLRDLSSPHPKAWSPYTPDFSWDNINLEVKRDKNKTTYEWQINLGENFNINTVMGFDIILSDIDEKDEDSTWKAWKRGTSKSNTSQRLGEIILVEKKDSIGSVEGTVVIKDSLINQVESIVITSLDHPNLWLRAEVDSLGHYKSSLPIGKYEITPEILFTSPLNSSGFNQDSRKVFTNKLVYAEVKSARVTQALSLNLITKPLPKGLFKEGGILFQDAFIEYEIDRFVSIYQEYFEIPGISMALIKEGEVVYDKVFGVTNTITNQPMTKNTLFEGASTTKSMFALMVLKLVEKGQLDLDKPLYEYLRFPNIEHDERYKTITARHVLNHQTGLSNWPVGSYSGSMSDAKADIAFDPGSDFMYSGEAMNYLGRVVAHIVKKPLSQLFEEEIVTAFELENTYFSYTNKLEQQIAMGHYHGYPRYKSKYAGVDSPASSIETMASDFSKILLRLLNEEYLSKESYQLISTTHQIIPKDKKLYDPEIPQGIAHGFFVSDTPQGKLIVHGGNNGDYDCKFGFMPEKQLGFVVFTNSNLGDEFIRLLELYLLRGRSAFEAEFD